MKQNFELFNVHPQGKLVRDCVKRAITKATGMEYQTVSLELNRYKKISGAEKYNEVINCNGYVENVLKMEKLSFPAQKGVARMNGERFTQSFPKGRFILNMAGHWTCCVDGVIYDTWDCRQKCVYTAYRLRSNEELKQLELLNKQQERQKELDKKRKEEIRKLKTEYKKKIQSLEKELENKIEKINARYDK